MEITGIATDLTELSACSCCLLQMKNPPELRFFLSRLFPCRDSGSSANVFSLKNGPLDLDGPATEQAHQTRLRKVSDGGGESLPPKSRQERLPVLGIQGTPTDHLLAAIIWVWLTWLFMGSRCELLFPPLITGNYRGGGVNRQPVRYSTNDV